MRSFVRVLVFLGASLVGGQSACPAAANTPADTADPVGVAKQWFAALWMPSVSRLMTLSRYPFAYRDDDLCPSGTASEAAKLSKALRCLRGDDVLEDDVKDDQSPRWRALEKEDLPSWAVGWLKRAPKDASPVSVCLSGIGSSTELVLFISKEGVREVWRKTWFKDDEDAARPQHRCDSAARGQQR